MNETSWLTTIVTVIVLAVIALAAPANVAAQNFDGPVPPEIQGELIYIPFPVEITVDGDLSDWEGLPSSYVDYGQTLSSDPAENGSFTFSVAADAQNFYITMQMPDKNIIAGKHGTNFWNEDSMEFYINASDDLNATAYWPKIFQININAADIGNTDPDALTITGMKSSDANVRGFVFETEDGWGFEAAVSLEGLLEPAHGVEIGFQAQINGASALDRNVKLIWSKADTADQSWQYPYLFGRAIFFELGREDIPQPSAVEVQPTAAPTPTAVPIPAQVSVNQTGYFPEGEKNASVANDSTDALDWSLRDSSGEVVLSGKTTVLGEDATSGDFLHQIDFSEYNTPGSGYQLLAGGLESVSFAIAKDIYSQLKLDALAYFYHNRSGTPIVVQYVGANWARPAGHITDDNVTCYKGDDPDGNSWPGCDYSLDVAGGWYDAGDFGKYVVNGGISAWTLMNLYERFPEVYGDGTLRIPEQSNGVPDLLDEARWEMEFLLSMQVPQGQPKAGMVHHKIHDRTWEPMPMVPPMEVDNDNEHEIAGQGRYLYPPSTAATLNLAATAAQCARIWDEIDPDFAATCLTAAQTAWEAALANPNIYAGNTPGDGGGNYEDGNVADEFYWAAAELYVTTGDETYLNYLLESDRFGEVGQFDWGNTSSLGTITLVSTENDLPQEQAAKLKANVLDFADEMLTIQENDGYSVLIDGEYPWGSNGLILNNTILMALAHDLSGEGKYLDSVRLSMDYILGHNPLYKSYVSGYGTYPMQHPHHRFWANDPANGYPPPPPGALAGGANATANDPAALNANLSAYAPSKRYVDEIGSYSTNEVTINWNAPLAWVATYLDQKSGVDAAKIETFQPEAAETESASPQQTAFPYWILIAAAAIVALVVAVWAIWLRRKAA
ncbi:MAG: glycoside hydrolase family 9 protein [Anaerolineales bacterium]